MALFISSAACYTVMRELSMLSNHAVIDVAEQPQRCVPVVKWLACWRVNTTILTNQRVKVTIKFLTDGALKFVQTLICCVQ